MNPYESYYVNQAGTGLVGFQGVRYQRGNGIFGRFFRGVLPTLLRYLGKQAVGAGAEIATDVLNGEKFSAAAGKRLKERGKNLIKAAIKRGHEEIETQAGSGIPGSRSTGEGDSEPIKGVKKRKISSDTSGVYKKNSRKANLKSFAPSKRKPVPNRYTFFDKNVKN